MRTPTPTGTPTGLVALVGGRFFYGWLVLFGAAVGLFASGAGQSFNFSAFVDPIAADLAVGSTAVASAYGFATLGQALRTPAFYIIAGGLFSMSMLSTALHFFQISVFTAQGLDPATAAMAFTLIAVAMAAAMPLVGRAVDRMQPRLALIAALCLQSASLAAAAFVADLPTAVIYAVLFGLTNASSMVIGTYIWPRYFGRRHIGSIMGTAQTAGVVGASLGPLPLGAGYDLFGSYAETLLILAALPAVAAVAAAFLRRPPLER
jgi:MFS family permease